LTKGLSLVLVDNKKAFNSLKKKLNWFSSADFKNVNDVDILEILREIDESRKNQKPTNFVTSFIVVESPTKAKTISSFFGNPSRRIVDDVIVYEILTQERLLVITASIGHDFDLVENEGKYGVIDKYIPIFSVLENKDKILRAMNLSSFEVDEVIVASDPDREGEKIAFDVTLDNKPFNLNTKRAEFHEITKYAFEEALKNLREINENLVAAQFVRRIADRWIGFEVSSFLQKLLKNSHLSAGRVQTPVLKWVCERTEKLKEKINVCEIVVNDVKIEFESEEGFDFKEVEVEIKKIKEEKKDLFLKPFNTSELLREAASKLKFSPQKTMQIAQELFEKGLITYHRTDSHRISPLGMLIAKEYIIENFGEEFVKLKSFESGGAHEAIRATSAMDTEDLRSMNILKNLGLKSDHFRLYDLIFKRFIASQMKDTVVLSETFNIKCEKYEKEIEIYSKILEEGYNLIWPVEIRNLEEGKCNLIPKIYQKSKYAPYTYADIISLMKERGIGRPSTYAVTIEKLLERKYVVEKNGYLFATRLGFKVIKIVENSRFYEYVNESFTARLEEVMDEIENGKRNYKEELTKLFSLLF
jgi:reverse gyrase